jgi:hypothetical protein
MRMPRWRFTIKSLMIAIGLVAGLLALPSSWRELAIALVLAIASLPVIGAWWLVHRGYRRFAKWSFCVLATSINVMYVAACVAPEFYVVTPLFLGWLVIILPVLVGLGSAWAMLSKKDGPVRNRHQTAIAVSVLVFAVLPALTLWTFWPLDVAFLVARPTLERLADRIAAGQSVGFPQRAGLFLILSSNVDPVSGDLGLLIDPNPSGRTGFVRVHPGRPTKVRGPIIGSELNVSLGSGWWYREDD